MTDNKKEEEMTPEQMRNALALYLTLLEKFSPELYELKKVMDVFMPYIMFGEIRATFKVQGGKVIMVEAYPVISRKVYENEKS